jgi:L,D-transpeptidase YcbB
MSMNRMLKYIPIACIIAFGCKSAPSVRGPDADAPGTRVRALLEGSENPVIATPGDTIHVGADVREFYTRRGFEPAWTDRSGFLPNGESLLAAIDSATRDGLDPDGYHREALYHLIERARRENEQKLPVGDVLGSVDILMTEAFIRYATDLVRGRVDPQSTGLPWKIPRGDAPTAQLLDEIAAQGDVQAALDRLRPTVPFYRSLAGVLPRYEQAVARGGWPKVSEPAKPGDRGPAVAQLRARLQAEGDPAEVGLVAKAADPQLYDDGLEQAVAHAQTRFGLESDGAAGRGTIEALNVPAEERLLTLKLNLDRWRWLPRDLGSRYFLVNIPGFDLVVMEGEREAMRMNVVVGKEGQKTPFFRDTLESIVVNPYWNIPPSIAEKEILPAIARNPGYLAQNNMESDGRGGFRQRPGPKNALGEVKFLFPNDHDIYLHDTPARHLFSEPVRAFSHGCIRVEKPRELAEYLLRTATSKPPGTYDRLRETGREQWVQLEQKIPIYIMYFTAAADPNGSAYFYGDLYDRDRDLQAETASKLGPDSVKGQIG